MKAKFKTKAITAQIPVQIDSKTTIFIKAGECPVKAKANYLAAKADSSKQNLFKPYNN